MDLNLSVAFGMNVRLNEVDHKSRVSGLLYDPNLFLAVLMLLLLFETRKWY